MSRLQHQNGQDAGNSWNLLVEILLYLLNKFNACMAEFNQRPFIRTCQPDVGGVINQAPLRLPGVTPVLRGTQELCQMCSVWEKQGLPGSAGFQRLRGLNPLFTASSLRAGTWPRFGGCLLPSSLYPLQVPSAWERVRAEPPISPHPYPRQTVRDKQDGKGSHISQEGR